MAVLSVLRELGCDEAQGYMISPPLPAREAFALAATEFAVGATPAGPAQQTAAETAARQASGIEGSVLEPEAGELLIAA